MVPPSPLSVVPDIRLLRALHFFLFDSRENGKNAEDLHRLRSLYRVSDGEPDEAATRVQSIFRRRSAKLLVQARRRQRVKVGVLVIKFAQRLRRRARSRLRETVGGEEGR
mmetsp:Transcript_14420/g.34251  ORF Transcript_14420/g.34251 Transcript_14420/m.34251 type:complete len:110 (-) Transcript_14420:4-333(-)